MPRMLPLLAQAPPPTATLDAATVFYITLLFIFLTAIVTTIVTKWSRDKCLKLFNGYHVSIEALRGRMDWGRCKVFSTGIEVVYDHPYIDPRGREKTSFMVYQQEMDQRVLSLFRYHDELDEAGRQRRDRQIRRAFNPGFLKRSWRGIRNVVNTLRDGFNAAIGAAVGQYQRANPLLATQGTAVTQIGQTLLGRLGNAYEPLLEQYMGQPVILEVADPINPNNATVEYTGFLAEYTQSYIAVFNAEHSTRQWVRVMLPDVEKGEALPPLPSPPPPGAPAPVLPAPTKAEHEVAIRIDGPRFRLQNVHHEPMIIRHIERAGFEPLELGVVLPPNGILTLPARDARGGTLVVERVCCVDVIAPRRYATVRHAGHLVERPGLTDMFAIERLPLVPKLLGREETTR